MAPTLDELVARMQSADAPEVGDSARGMLEARVLPNQVLGQDAPRLAQLLVAGLPGASPVGRVETWELLAQLAAGACGPTAADRKVVVRVTEALLPVLPKAVERLHAVEPSRDDYLVVDVLDAMLCFENGPDRRVVTDALRTFASRGPAEQRRVEIILGHA